MLYNGVDLRTSAVKLLLMELAVFLVYAIYSIATYSNVEISFTSDDMELLRAGGGYEPGGGVFRPLLYGSEGCCYAEISTEKGNLLYRSILC